MSKSWKSVSAAEAAVHPLYGVKNWLVVFAIGVLFGLLREIGSLSGEALKAGISVTALLSVDHPATNFLKITLALETVAVAVIYFLLFTKHPQFRPVTTGLLLGLFPVVVLLGFLNPFDGLGSAIAMSFFSWAISCAVWVTYLNRSRRVRVTFEHLIRVDKPGLSIMVQPGADPTIGSTSAVAPRQNSPPAASASPPAGPPTPSLVSTQSNPDVTSSDEELWARALSEFESQSRRPGLWARSFSESGGNESAAKASYLGARVLELKIERQAAIAEHERIARQLVERERLANLSEEERAYALLPKGQCPNCDTVLPLTMEACPRCRAMFGPNSAWRLVPLKET